MKSILTKKVLFLALVAVTVFTTGCIKEDLDECYKLTLKLSLIHISEPTRP